MVPLSLLELNGFADVDLTLTGTEAEGAGAVERHQPGVTAASMSKVRLVGSAFQGAAPGDGKSHPSHPGNLTSERGVTSAVPVTRRP